MNSEEQDQHLAQLLLSEYKGKVHLACLQSKLRQVHDCVSRLHDASERFGFPNVNFLNIGKTCSGLMTIQIGELFSDLKSAHEDLLKIRNDIDRINSR